MKKMFFVIVVMFLSTIVVSAQKQSNPIKGNLVFSFNQGITFIGFMGPKISKNFVFKSLKVELSVVAMPGLLIKPETKPGMALGSIIIIKKDNWKIKPIIGVTFIKTTQWQPMLGIGLIF